MAPQSMQLDQGKGHAPFTWNQKNQLVASAVSVGLAAMVIVLFKSYVVPAAVLAVGLYVAWNGNKTVTMAEWRLLATTTAVGTLFLLVPYLQEKIPLNYMVIIILLGAVMAAFWVPAVWRHFSPDESAPKPPMGRRPRILSIGMVLLFLMATIPAASAADASTPAIMVCNPAAPECSSGQGVTGLANVPLCNDWGRITHGSNYAHVTHVASTATKSGDSVNLDVSFDHQFFGSACMPFSSTQVCREKHIVYCVKAPQEVHSNLVTLGDFCLAKFSGTNVPNLADLDLPSAVPSIDGENAGSLCDNDAIRDGVTTDHCLIWGCQTAQAVALLPTGYTLEIFAKTGGKQVNLYANSVSLGDPAGVLGAKNAAKLFHEDLHIGDIQRTFADAKVPMPTHFSTFVRVTYSFQGSGTCGGVSLQVRECWLKPHLAYGVHAINTRVDNSFAPKLPGTAGCMDANAKSIPCAPITLPAIGSDIQMTIGQIMGKLDGILPGVNPGAALMGVSKPASCTMTIGSMVTSLKACLGSTGPAIFPPRTV